MFDGFNFHLLRHTAGSLMALAGMDPAVACERLGHSDGGALFLQTYRHLYEGEKREQAANSMRSCVRAWTTNGQALRNGRQTRSSKQLLQWAHLGLNQGPLACEASALPLSYAPGMA